MVAFHSKLKDIGSSCLPGLPVFNQRLQMRCQILSLGFSIKEDQILLIFWLQCWAILFQTCSYMFWYIFCIKFLLYCMELYCTTLYWIAYGMCMGRHSPSKPCLLARQNCIALYCIVPRCIVLHCIVPASIFVSVHVPVLVAVASACICAYTRGTSSKKTNHLIQNKCLSGRRLNSLGSILLIVWLILWLCDWFKFWCWQKDFQSH